MNYQPLGDTNCSIQITVVPMGVNALLTVRAKDQELDVEQLRSLSDAALTASDELASLSGAPWIMPIVFHPEPTTTWQIPFASVVWTPEEIGLVFAELIPGREALGSVARHTLLQCGIEALRKWRVTPDELPVSIGPHFSLARRMAFLGTELLVRAGRRDELYKAVETFALSMLPSLPRGARG